WRQGRWPRHGSRRHSRRASAEQGAGERLRGTGCGGALAGSARLAGNDAEPVHAAVRAVDEGRGDLEAAGAAVRAGRVRGERGDQREARAGQRAEADEIAEERIADALDVRVTEARDIEVRDVDAEAGRAGEVLAQAV